MLQKHRLKHLLTAGILTGLVFATLVALAWRDTGRSNADAAKTRATLTKSVPEGTDALRAENAQLRNAFETMRAREKEYHTQLETANRAIAQLQDVAANPRYEAHAEREHDYKHGEDKDD